MYNEIWEIEELNKVHQQTANVGEEHQRLQSSDRCSLKHSVVLTPVPLVGVVTDRVSHLASLSVS